MAYSLRPTIKTILCMFAVSACTLEENAPRTDAQYGKNLYDAKCSQCHSANAQGAGPASLGLGVAPPNLTTLAQRNGAIFPRNYVMGVIDGYSQRDHSAAAMPEFGAEGLGPTVIVEEDGLGTPIPSDLLALANYLESIQQ